MTIFFHKTFSMLQVFFLYLHIKRAIMKIDNKSGNATTELKHRIICVAMEAFAANGIRPITMDMIAHSLKISKRTLYENFKDKEALLLAGVRLHHKKMHDHLLEFTEKKKNVLEIILHYFEMGLEEMRLTNAKFYSDMNKYPIVLKEIHKQRANDKENSIGFLQKGVEQGLFRDDIRFDIVGRILGDTIDSSIRNICADSSPEVTFRTIIPVWMRGISTPKGQQILDEFLKNNKIYGSGNILNVEKITEPE